MCVHPHDIDFILMAVGPRLFCLFEELLSCATKERSFVKRARRY